MEHGATEEPAPGRVWIRDGRVEAVTSGTHGSPASRRRPRSTWVTRSCCPGSSTCTTTSPTTRCRCGPSPAGRNRGCTTSIGPTPTPTRSRSPNRPGCTPRRLPKRCSATSRSGRWPAGPPRRRAGRPRTAATAPSSATSTREDAGTGSERSIYTSVATKTGDALATAVRHDGRWLRVHLPLRRRTARVARAARLHRPRRRRGASPDLHRHPLLRGRRRRLDEVGRERSGRRRLVADVEHPALRADDVDPRRAGPGRAGLPRIGLGTVRDEEPARRDEGRPDHCGPARLRAHRPDIVEMVTCNPGTLLERCWNRPIGRLVPGAFADVTVVRGRGRGTPGSASSLPPNATLRWW